MNLQIPHISKSRILISPLNWGFGHVSRTIPIIQSFLEMENEVYIACDTAQKNVYEAYFSSQKVKFLDLEGYPFRFNGKGNFGLDLFLNGISLSKHIQKEHSLTEKWVIDYSIEYVIADHRYGVYSKKVTSIFLTHQYNLPTSTLSFIANKIHHRLIKPFQKFWIADYNSNTLAGKLSICESEKASFIGALSRFAKIKSIQSKTKNTLIISGPEAYWKDLLSIYDKELANGVIDSIIGPKHAQQLFSHFNAIYYSNDNWLACDEILLQSKTIYGYSGYSTIMDLQFLKCEAKLVPCKGQYEQIYLYQKHFKDADSISF